MTREELLKALRPLEWRKLTGSLRTIYKADRFMDWDALISEMYPKWTTSFDNVEYNTLADAKQAAEEYRKDKILSHFNLEEK
ncbi:MAG: hypothetical protein HXN09_06040 [Porphyromonadaceae bacterium]|nr:hypothetical protein [Porphyromonadaceae bacterium]